MATVEVRSDRNPEVVYQVDAEAGTCTCPHYVQKLKLVNENEGKTLVCKHVKAIRERGPWKDFGWANSWNGTPEEIQKCRDAGHQTTDVDVGPPMRGLEHVVRCPGCRIVYRYDSSD